MRRAEKKCDRMDLLTMSENDMRSDDTFKDLRYMQLFIKTLFAFKLWPSVRVNVQCQAADLKEVKELRHSESQSQTVPVRSPPSVHEPVFISYKPKLPHRTRSESLNVRCMCGKKTSDHRALIESKSGPANISFATANRLVHRNRVPSSMARQLSNSCGAGGDSLLVWTSSLDIFVPRLWFGVQKRLLLSTTSPSYPIEYPYASFLLACCQCQRSVRNSTATNSSVPCDTSQTLNMSESDPCTHRSAAVNSSSLNTKTVSDCVQSNTANLIVPYDGISHQLAISAELSLSKKVQPEMEQFSEPKQSDYSGYSNSSSMEAVLSSTNNSAAMNAIDCNNISDLWEKYAPSGVPRNIVNSSLGSQATVYVPQLDNRKESLVGLGMLPECDSCYASVDSSELMMFPGIEDKLDEQTSEFSEENSEGSTEEKIVEEPEERKANVEKFIWEMEEEKDAVEAAEKKEEWREEEVVWEDEEKAEVEVEENDESEVEDENEEVKQEVESEEDGEEADESSCEDDMENESEEWSDDDDDDDHKVSSSIKELNCCVDKEQTKSSFFVRASDCDSDSSDSSHSETSDDDSSSDDDDDDYDNDDWEISSNSPALTCLEDLDPFQINGLYIPPASTIPVGRPSCTSKTPAEPESASSAILKDINDHWNEQYGQSVPSKTRAKSSVAGKKPKKVDFVTEHPVIIPMLNELWEEDYMSARCGSWEQLARDHERFQNRIKEVERQISFVFSASHRTRVFRRLYPSCDQ